jgi:choline dehydrogenase-like flavoprotein
MGLPTAKIQFKRTFSHKAPVIVDEIVRAMGCTEIKANPGFNMAHPMGTCKMGSSDTDSVVDRDLRVHGTDDLYVCSSAVFPTAGAANPTLTIAALAHRLGQYLHSRV